MHPRVYQEFERICSERQVRGSVLEVGAKPSTKGLLCMKSLANATDKVGINLDGPHEFRDFKIVKGNANSMDCFPDNSFDVVLCNAMLEHDKYFWLTIAEIQRVTKKGGLIVVGAPGYISYRRENKIKNLLARLPFSWRLRSNRYFEALLTATITFQVHDAPGDYYRFSEQTFKEVVFANLLNTEIYSIMAPPRIIGVGVKE